jgi:hypothetical protein
MIQDPGKARARQVIKGQHAIPSAWNDCVLRLSRVDGLFSVSGHACLTSVRAATRIRWLGPVPVGLGPSHLRPRCTRTGAAPPRDPGRSALRTTRKPVLLCPSRCVRHPRLGPARTSPPAAPCWCANDLTLTPPGLPMKRSRCRSTPLCRPCGRWDPRSGSPSSPPAVPVGPRGDVGAVGAPEANGNNARRSPGWSVGHSPRARQG